MRCLKRITRNIIELLAPAGNWDCLRAAVSNGADAVYFGVENFNARVRAKNFKMEELPEVMAYLHKYNVREVFVHGALCVSYSGQCLTSEMWGGRSANRGECAQACRLPYDLIVDDEVKEMGSIAFASFCEKNNTKYRKHIVIDAETKNLIRKGTRKTYKE